MAYTITRVGKQKFAVTHLTRRPCTASKLELARNPDQPLVERSVAVTKTFLKKDLGETTTYFGEGVTMGSLINLQQVS